jgi:hypothetical protein
MLALSLLLIVTAGNAFSSSTDDITVGFIKEKMLEKNGDRVTYTIKCTVQNKGPSSGEVYVTLQGVDRHGYELDSVLLTADISGKSKKNLSSKRRLSYDLYRKISKWKLKELKFF